MPLTSQGHIYTFHSGDPNESPEFTIQGHINILTQSTGKFIFRAIDGSWKAHMNLQTINFPGDDTVSGTFIVDNIQGTSPFTTPLPFGPVPIDELFTDLVGSIPNLFFFVSVNEPPTPPPTV